MTWSELAGRSVLVTGASGFIGSHLCRRLAHAGATVHATSRHAQDEEEGLLWHCADLADAAAVRALVETTEPEVLFHLASHVAGSRSLELVAPTFHANLASTVYLLEAATETGCRRFVQAGSLEEGEDGAPPAVPASPYAAAKAAASSYARMFHALYETPIVVARLFMVYGPAQRDLKKLIPYVILSLLRGEPVKLSSGTRRVDWVYVDDVVEGLLRLALAEGVEGRQVDLGTGELVTVRGVVEKLFEQLAPGERPVFGDLADRSMEQVRAARVGETAELLGWRPPTSLDDGLAATVDYYRAELSPGLTPERRSSR